jgi:hypothetical protein
MAKLNEEEKEKEDLAKRCEEKAAAEAFRAAAAARSKEAEEAAAREKLAKEEAERKAREEAEKQRKKVAVEGEGHGDGAARPNAQSVGTLAASSCQVLLISGKLVLKNSSDTNKKIGGDTVLASWSTCCSLTTSSADGLEYRMTMKSDVVNQATMKRLKLDKLLRDSAQPVREVFGHEPFPAGSTPKILVKKGSKTLKWEYSGEDSPLVKAILEAARNSTIAAPLFQMKYSAQKQRIEPCGVAVVLLKAQQVAGGGEVVLS